MFVTWCTNARLRKNPGENGAVFALVRQCYRNTLVKSHSRADILRRKHNRVRGEIISRHRLSSFSPPRVLSLRHAWSRESKEGE